MRGREPRVRQDAAGRTCSRTLGCLQLQPLPLEWSLWNGGQGLNCSTVKLRQLRRVGETMKKYVLAFAVGIVVSVLVPKTKPAHAICTMLMIDGVPFDSCSTAPDSEVIGGGGGPCRVCFGVNCTRSQYGYLTCSSTCAGPRPTPHCHPGPV